MIFFLKSLSHFSKFLVNAYSDLIKYIFKTAFNNNSVDILSVRKYCKHFTHKLNTFSFASSLRKSIRTSGPKNAQNWTRKMLKTSLPIGFWPPSVANRGPHGPWTTSGTPTFYRWLKLMFQVRRLNHGYYYF